MPEVKETTQMNRRDTAAQHKGKWPVRSCPSGAGRALSRHDLARCSMSPNPLGCSVAVTPSAGVENTCTLRAHCGWRCRSS
jgi:hypothetical protein